MTTTIGELRQRCAVCPECAALRAEWAKEWARTGAEAWPGWALMDRMRWHVNTHRGVR